ncbi:MAG TPA: gluconate 2-dehydrogenase subunit 3 family protein [Sulfurovum sp.]|nr:gluconate 2-dehydrogenase subunit 3 family protein [Sulfurovum sp.]HQS73236.1 gluconate 2-dehydrogenase subunit 3 family protein [Sulfurovum sp.]HQS78327.1 gluconate 2-dehydrogenase subunit 3 family protein [Sulfurovum sp.]HQT29253.1 gluconate 2-dehydrogenase subunit 3 family protein [Sulfurovum sp.]
MLRKDFIKKTGIMKRRNFLILGSALGLFSYLKLKKSDDFEVAFKNVKPTIEAVQGHMFPQNSKLPLSLQTSLFMYETMSHPSFDKDIRVFVLEGASELEKRHDNHFTSLAAQEKEIALRAYEETNYGSAWLSQIMTLTLEAHFSDPIYGVNKNEKYWDEVGAYGGLPRPKQRYIGTIDV